MPTDLERLQIPTYWHEPGSLSIVLQGGLFGGNVTETALHCQHWRDLFPNAQIILAISATDMFADVQPGLLVKPPLAKALRENSHFQSAIARIEASCDHMVLSKGALPLPPIKSISLAANNINLQIVAAQAGLALATGRHVLRVRSDLVFANRGFISQYTTANLIPRGSAATLSERVLISPLYTLNPFTFERMPLHFSDWFHFGLTSDVRALWEAPEMTFADATYFKTHKSVPGSSKDERVFMPRRAVEQHILYHYFKLRLPQLVLDYLNDQTSIDLSLDILVDNFIICDLVKAACVFDKYAHDIDNPAKWLHCITAGDWEAMAATTGADRREVLESKRLAVTNPESVPFPRHYPPRALSTKIGYHSQGEIIVWHADGVLLHGPYDTLPRGRYVVTVHLSALEGEGTIDLAVTVEAGRETLSARQITVDGSPITMLELSFDIITEVAAKLEVVMTIRDMTALVVNGVTIAERSDEPQHSGARSFSATALPMKSRVGVAGNGKIWTRGRAGHLLYGPYISVIKGTHAVTLTIPEGKRAGRSVIEILSGSDHRVLLKQPVCKSDIDAGSLRCEFQVDEPLHHVEVRVSVSRSASFAISDVTFDSL